MKHIRTKTENCLQVLLWFLVVFLMLMALKETAVAKSLYLAAEHHLSLFDAWNINPDGTTTKQATYNLQYATDPAGIAVDSDSKIIFITSEMSGGVEIVDPVTLTYLGVSAGPSNLAGIDVDDANDIVYAVRRNTNDLHIFEWDSVAKSLNQIAKIDLPGCIGAFGIALDELRGILWVSDTAAGGNWDQDTFEVAGLAVPVDIDIIPIMPDNFVALIGLLDSTGTALDWQFSYSNVSPDSGAVRLRIIPFSGQPGQYETAVWPAGMPRPTTPRVTEIEVNNSFGARNFLDAVNGQLVIDGEIVGRTTPGPPIVRAYNISTWTEDASKSFSPSHNPVGIAVDRRRNVVYTVSIIGGATVPLGTGSTLLSKYDVASGTETTVDMGDHGGVGVAVDETTGYVYVTGGAWAGDNLTVWDTTTDTFSKLQDTGDIGNPAGLAIGNVSYNPLNLAKNDVVVGHGVYIGQTFTYEITFGNEDNIVAITDVRVIDTLPVELDFVSETVDGVGGTGVYDPDTHTVVWDIGTIPAGQPGPPIALVVRVNENAAGGSTIYNYCTIESNETPPTTVIGEDPEDPTPEDPGTYIIPNRPPNCSEAYADPGCLWPPNHKFVDVSILGVTDPDGDPVSIQILTISSDEATATEKGAGGQKHVPDASGVGTDTASVRAERSGKQDGRVYQIQFLASDGRGGACEGSVMVNVPHDQYSEDCPAVDSGQNYDATQIN